MARPVKYKEEFDKQAYKLCLLGATDKDLADFFEIVESTINKWKHDFPTFSESIKNGKKMADANVASRLYERACGFEHDSEEIKVINIGDYQQEVQRVPIRKIYPPDPTSMIFWLKNRQPKTWRDKQDVDVTTNGESVNNNISVEIVKSSDED